MKKNETKTIPTITTYLMLGVSAALIVYFVIACAYVLFWGIIIGLALWIIALIKEKIFPPKILHEEHYRIIDVEKDEDESVKATTKKRTYKKRETK